MLPAPIQPADALYVVGHWLLEQRRFADALHVFRTMLVSAPGDERGWLGLGASHEELGNDGVAAGLYALGEAAIPTSFRCSLAHARVLRRLMNDHADAAFERAEERALEVDDGTASAIAHERRAA
ncbi:MAG: hypothetical protein U0270_19180 [Labilithrix sp.]